MKTFLAILATAALVATAAQAHESKYESEMHHGKAHHVHADGNWHGVKPHMHDGRLMHRGHTHMAPKCPDVRWHDTKDLQKWRVDHDGSERCYSDEHPTFHWNAR